MTARLVPVLDIMGGVVVRGVAGDRENYRPLQSRLAAGADPLQIARALRDAFRLEEFYVADLDAIRWQRPQIDVIAALAALGVKLSVDGGVRDAASAERLLQADVARVIVGLETLPDFALLGDLVRRFGSGRLAFSLDLQNGRPLFRADRGLSCLEITERAAQAGIDHVIVLDLAAVGVGGGIPTLELCGEIHESYPHLTLWTGGGVRDRSDVAESESYGVAGVLVASALHDGRITPAGGS